MECETFNKCQKARLDTNDAALMTQQKQHSDYVDRVPCIPYPLFFSQKQFLYAKIISKGISIMLKAEKIKKEIDVLPTAMLDDVEKFIKGLKTRKKNGKRKSSLLAELADIAADIDLPRDFSKHHDHYLYGLPKK